MKFLTRIRNLIFGTPTNPFGVEGLPVVESIQDTMLGMAERLAVVNALVSAMEYHFNTYKPTYAEVDDYRKLVEERAKLNFQIELSVTKQKERTVIERLTTENVHLLNDLRAAENKYQRDVYGLNNEGDVIGGEPAGGFANDAALYKKLWLDSRLTEITDYRDLKEFEHYWLLSTAFDSLHVAQCKDKTISGHWITEDNNTHTMEKYRFFGPIQKPEIKKAYYDPAVEVCNADQ